MPTVKTKRWDDLIEPDDGTRILVMRYRPRALPKKDETWSEWIRDLGPSTELHAAYYGKAGMPISWSRYCAVYFREMHDQRERIAALAYRVIAGETLTLLCSSTCTREERCHRSLLRKLILGEVARRSGSAEPSPADEIAE